MGLFVTPQRVDKGIPASQSTHAPLCPCTPTASPPTAELFSLPSTGCIPKPYQQLAEEVLSTSSSLLLLTSSSPPHCLHLCPQMPDQQWGHSKPRPMSHTDVLEGRINVLEGNVSAKAQVPVAQGWQPQAGASQPPLDSEPPATTFLPGVPHAPCPAFACLVSPCPLPPDTVTSACPFKNSIIIDIMIFGPIVKC